MTINTYYISTQHSPAINTTLGSSSRRDPFTPFTCIPGNDPLRRGPSLEGRLRSRLLHSTGEAFANTSWAYNIPPLSAQLFLQRLQNIPRRLDVADRTRITGTLADQKLHELSTIY
jgi:hypothetical protein